MPRPFPVKIARRMAGVPPRKLLNWVSMIDTLFARLMGITFTTVSAFFDSAERTRQPPSV